MQSQSCGEVLSMSSSGAVKCDISETLFSDDDPKTAIEAKVEDEDSPEFLLLVDEQTKKQERRKKKPRTIAAAMFDRSLVEVEEMARTGDWDQARSGHLVALYDRMHRKCYGIEAVELGPTERYNAAMMASNMVKRHFGGDFPEAAEFMRWVWVKEIKDEKWRREQGRFDNRRIGYRLMFSGTLITDYRLFLARRSHNT